MKNFISITAIITIMAEIALGTFANVFIALVNCTDYHKRKKISLADQILTALAVSRIGLLLVILTNFCSTMINPVLYAKETRCIISFIWAITHHLNTWLATVLSIFYLLKIANFSNLIFLHLKRKVKNVIIVAILANFLFMIHILMMKNLCEVIKGNEHEIYFLNKTKLSNMVNLTLMSIFTLDNVIPFITSLICFLLLIYSLCKHLRTMKIYGKGTQDASTMAHTKALQTVVSFLLLFALFFLTVTVSGWNYKTSLSEPIHLICQAIGILYPSSHSFILIWGNKKLKQAFILVMMKVKFWLREGKTFFNR
uniref:Taste receptor type 2 n=1 Tax=Nannospalax galili TaxID=1026970 RepID=A0A7S5W7Z8_NANGA|nr:taste receptor type 2 member 136 [Nannospalax galili]QKE46162.1 taste receptor type 2 member 136 [Nannospalax galili]QKE46163.1 taste receptor type 2 member 136 [Nannospalax galili]QKE46165.1 taste receptor type 2 member 136 [Nannospalax galili]QKE46166.1 taste receptor type 2 member 136 [Nannospalax galili]